MKRVLFGFGIAVLVAGSQVTFGQPGGNPFIDHSDTGETVHVLPTPASIHSPRDTQPTIAPPDLHVFAASYGSGNLVNHGGHQISNAGFVAIYWNSSVSGSTATSSSAYTTLKDELTAFLYNYSDGSNYAEDDLGADYSVIQQYGIRDAISGQRLADQNPVSGVGYLIDTKPTQSSITDSAIQSYIAGLLTNGAVPTSDSLIYGVYFPSGMKIRLQGGASCTSFCGYHGNFSYTDPVGNSHDIKYAVFPYPNCRGCSLSGFKVADMLTIVTSHEIREAVTDPDLDAWYDNSGYEADDKCAWHNLYKTTNGGFWVQPEFSNGGTVTDAAKYTATYPQLNATTGACVQAK